ncbi:cobaltochelatase subunit CobN [Hwanghaeella sp.]|uniref:cobaltochelatase subunit CobN n=1 Tax=Hwanghaeella sp. TaxID=2605943 RepID=UPI003CCBCD25
MHLLAAQPGGIDDGSEAIDLGQTPGDIVVITAADTEIACLATAQARRLADGDAPSLRCANLMHLGHNYSVDLYVEEIVAKARFVLCRLLGGRSYWPYGVDEVAATCRAAGIPVVFLPGDDKPDPELRDLSPISDELYTNLWEYFVQGGIDNAEGALIAIAAELGHDVAPPDPAPLLKAGLYWPGASTPSLTDSPWADIGTRPVVAITFYRALFQAGNLGAIDTLIAALQAQGIVPLPVFATSLKDPVSVATLEELFGAAKPDVILNGMGFAVGKPGALNEGTVLDAADCPVLQVVFSGSNLASWQDGTKGLSPRDIAMNVALPEVDGRVLTRAVSFKGSSRRDPNVEADIVGYEPVADRCGFVAELAANWARLRRSAAKDRRVGIVLANYPNRDGRLGNGVGLDTPAGTLTILNALAEAGYTVSHHFETGDHLIDHLAAGPTNAAVEGRVVRETISRADYDAFFATLPTDLQEGIVERWGKPDGDPFFRRAEDDFALPIFTLGNVAVGLQPARGYNIDPVQSYHDPALLPPHGYLAFYAWMRRSFGAQAILHMGKHGTMEWLPGKSIALSQSCLPEAVFGPMPHLYPFIVNDPGEGTQAKRRAQAVIVDHLTPPLTRAESYGPLRDLELLVDEYYDAAQGDPRRVKVLRQEILDLTRSAGLDKDIGIAPDAAPDDALAALDNHLCELKEMQIRDGLHIFGRSPEGALRDGLLMALVRAPRGTGEGDRSLLRAMAQDLSLDPEFDPLDCVMGEAWSGDRPDLLADVDDAVWRTKGDTVERLELLGLDLIAGRASAPGPASQIVLETLTAWLKPAVEACGPAEIAGVIAGLDGRFVPPGPSGAPSRGRPEVLPTGRNFYSVDTRMVPTPAAWSLGWKSAQMLVERYAQDHGDYPRQMAISAWGTANMRTGGDDVAQALALMGVRPTWDDSSRRVTGFEILPADLLDRPRVDVTFRISGFFRDAFPGLIDLIDSAARAVAALDEAEAVNPLAAHVRQETAALIEEQGMTVEDAVRRSGARVFGSRPGAYGAGLQALIDEKIWKDEGDLADAYLTWGGYAYGAGQEGEADREGFSKRLTKVQAVVQNQDNREHDLLDSDDYYQFEGGMTAAVRHLSGDQPAVYHNDHSRPESPRIRTLKEEIGRVVRARVVNPKWIAGVMRHGYKGAFEMAATVDYLFAFSATARAVEDHHFDLVFDAYLDDAEVRNFLADHNPAALKEMAERLLEAQDRGLWKPRRNSTRDALQRLSA